MNTHDSIEILHTTGKRLCKAHRQDGSIQPYEDARNFRRESASVSSISELYELLKRLQTLHQSCIIRGRFVGDARAAEVTAQLPEFETRADGTQLSGRPEQGYVFRRKSYFDDQALHTIMLDVEDTSTDIDPKTDPEGACREWIARHLPTELHEASFIWQLSNSFGHPTKPGLRVHLWFWLSSPRTSATLKAWAKRESIPIDHSVFTSTQPHYTAAPVFDAGMRDPVAMRLGFCSSLASDEVRLDIEDAAERLVSSPVAESVPARTEISDEQLADLEAALAHPSVLRAGGNEEFAIKILYALLSLGALGCKLWLGYCEKAADDSAQPDPDWPRRTWETHQSSAPPLSDFTSIYKTAGALGWQNPYKASVADTAAFEPVSNDPTPTPAPAAQPMPEAQYLCTDLANANRLKEWYGRALVSCSGSFFGYDGKRWTRDQAFAAQCAARLSKLVKAEADAAEQIALSMSHGNEFAKAAMTVKRRDQAKAVDSLLASPNGAHILAAIEKAEALKRWSVLCESATAQQKALSLLRDLHAVDASVFDRDPALFNCANGTIDLTTGRLKPHDPADMITKMSPIDYDANAKCPLWEKFIAEIHEPATGAFLQRWGGYTLTGYIREQCMLVKLGDGGNGKTTETETLAGVQGDYSDTLASGIFTNAADRHPTELAALHGLRSAITSEADESAVLTEAKIKQLTGGDKVSARFMYKDFFSFYPTCKFQMLTNHRPVVRGQDEGIWRRLRLVHYKSSFGDPADVAAGRALYLRDKDLKQKLKAESSGILAWLVRGAIDWLANGLRTPDTVLEASARYRSEQNRVGQFLREQCVLAADTWSPYSGAISGLYPSYTQWCRENGHQPLNKPNFIERLEQEVPEFRPAEKKIRDDSGVRKTVRGCFGVRVNLADDAGDQPKAVLCAAVQLDNRDLI